MSLSISLHALCEEGKNQRDQEAGAADQRPHDGPGLEGGLFVLSHFNDSGFWLVKSLVGLDEKSTLKPWTIMETLVGFTGFLVALVISFFA